MNIDNDDPFFMPPQKRDKWAKDQAAKIKQASNIDNDNQGVTPAHLQNLGNIPTRIDNDELLENLEHDYGFSTKEMDGIKRCFAAQRQALRDEVMAAIGEDEYPDYSPHTAMTSQWDANKRIGDELRAKLRTAISTIFEGKGDK